MNSKKILKVFNSVRLFCCLLLWLSVVKIISVDEDEAVFDVIGIDAAIANALRRIMIAEVYPPFLLFFSCFFWSFYSYI